MEIALLGHMGRDEALAEHLSNHRLHVIGQWQNPGLLEKAENSGGTYSQIGSIADTEQIADRVEDIKPDMFITNFDDSLAAGVIEAVRKRSPETMIPCPDQAASRIEWDKFYFREIIEDIAPKYNPTNFMTQNQNEANEAIDYFEATNTELALKPRNLTGGKGVKVMGKHFETFAEAKDYAARVLSANDQTGIEVQEKMEGHEFTLQILTDGKTIILPPATYDYPYREDDDTGPGTGGMGSFSMEDGLLPFLSQQEYDEAIGLSRQILKELSERGHDYKGWLYPSFFKTKDGLKIVEANARGGDPELINVLDLADDSVDMAEALKQVAVGELNQKSVRFKQLGSTMLYLVSPEYGYPKGPAYEYELDTESVKASGCQVRFAASEKIGPGRYRTVGSSRSVGISATGPTAWEAREKIHEAIRTGFGVPLPLHYRNQVAEKAYIESLR